MIDKTTQGVTAEPEEVEAVLHNLCGYHLAEPDALSRYTVLTREQVLYDALVAAIKRERGRALADLVAGGQTLTQIAASTNLGTRQRVQRMITMAKAADEAADQIQQASRDFEERLAAVQATLDEVVSGIAAEPLEPFGQTVATERVPVPYAAAGNGFEARADGYEPAHRQIRSEDGYNWPDGFDDNGSDGDPAFGDDPDFGGEPEPVLEPTQYMPALRPLLNPTKEMPPTDEDAPWWRRTRDTGAA